MYPSKPFSVLILFSRHQVPIKYLVSITHLFMTRYGQTDHHARAALDIRAGFNNPSPKFRTGMNRELEFA